MRHNTLINLCLIILCAAATTSCGDFLRERSNDLAYIRTADDLDELLIGSCYMSVAPPTPRVYDNFYCPQLHYMADETEELIGDTRYSTESNIRTRSFGYYTWQQRVGDAFDPQRTFKENVDWLRIYKHILTLNIVLDESRKLPSSSVAEQNKIRRVQAEAHFLRAAYHFILVNLYALPYAPQYTDAPGIPLKLSHYIEDKKYTRESIGTVYDQITRDLRMAISLSKGIRSRSLYRISEAGILLFASRVALYMQDWSTAVSYAHEAMTLHPGLYNLNGLEEKDFFFSSSNPELIFSMGGSLVSAEMGSSAPIGGFAVSQELSSLYDKEDLRGKLYIEQIKVSGALPNGHYFRPRKTNPNDMSRCEVSDLFVLRGAEIYLNLAEALAMQGQGAEALKWLNQLIQTRYKAGTAPTLPNMTDKELVQAIRTERRKELCFEGQRWFDLRRYKVCEPYPDQIELTHTYTIYKKENRNSIPDVTYYYTLPADEIQGYVLPIPREERVLNDKIQDNIRPLRQPSKIIRHGSK